jgi:hypothetical protein
MPIAASDLKLYGSTNMEEVDGATQGGAIDLTTRIVWDSAALANVFGSTVDFVSDQAGDNSQTVEVYGRDSTGSIVTDSKTLNGTTVVAGTVTFAEILKVTISAAHAGNVTLKRHSDAGVLVTIESGVLQIRRLFYGAASDTSSGSTRNYYDKAVLKNTNGTKAALSLTVKTNTDPATGDCLIAVESSVNGTGTSTNRQTAPSGVTGAGFSDGPTAIPGTDLAPGAAIGIWFNLVLTAGLAAAQNTYIPEFDFQGN